MRSIKLAFWLCFLLPLLSNAHRMSKWQSRNLKTISKIYNLNVYPNNVGLFANGTESIPAGLFNEKATGRIDPVGTFTGFQDSAEYFFGLAPVAHASPTNGVFTSAEVVQFQSECPEVASSTVYFTSRAYDPGQPDDGKFLAILKQVAFWRFDKNGAVLKYDAWIPNLNKWSAVTNGVDISAVVQAQAPTIQGLCGAIQQRCVGPNTQYDSLATCVATLSKKPFGNYDEAWGDNVVCRTIHVLLAKIRPEVHCAHVGPTGGGKCIDIAYNDAYFNDEALFGDTLAKTFICPRDDDDD
ncbi:hypothetical protein MMC30_007407 [Trapelia coarctata]|nr:hypothetical protein [Trapelia coarctata]